MAILLQGCPMSFRSIAFVGIEAIHGIKLVHFHHDPVSRDLCNDTGCSYGTAQAIPVHDGTLRDVHIEGDGSVNEQIIGRGTYLIDSLHHCEPSGLEHVYFVNNLGRNDSHPCGESRGSNSIEDFLTGCGCQQFGIIQPRQIKASREDHGSGYHRPGKRAAACLVYSGYPPGAIFKPLFFEPKRDFCPPWSQR